MEIKEQSASNARYAHLLARVALRDRKAFHTLYQSVGADLNGVAFRILRTNDLAQDVLQESFMQIWNNAHTYNNSLGEPITWMRAIVRYRALDKLQAHKRKREDFVGDDMLNDFHDEAPTSDPAVLVEIERTMGSLAHCLETLSSVSRASILAAYYNGESREEISARNGVPVNTVKSWLKRGLERLEQCLRQTAI